MAYDSLRGRIIVYTSANASTTHGQLWSWDGSAWNLESENGPSKRHVQSIAYDVSNNQIVLFGGWDISAGPAITRSDTWVWDGTLWTDVTPAVSNPAPRRFNSLSYDEANKRVIMFGGIGDGCHLIRHDTWAWDGATWTPIADQSNLGLVGSVAVYDSGSLSTIRFGGQLSCSGAMAQVFQTLGGTGWETIPTGGVMPSIRKNAGLAPIGPNGDMILYGGVIGSVPKGDTWLWNGAMWTELIIPAPPARGFQNGYFGMAYDEARNEIVLFGGQGANGAPLGDTWVLRPVVACSADLNSDGIMGIGDINLFINYILTADPRADFNGDGINDNGDIVVFVEAFLSGCP